MPLNDTNIPNASSDVVGVFDSDFNQVFSRARPMKASIKEMSRPMEHPVENGSVITDHRIVLPNEIEITVVLPGNEYRPVYQQIKQLFLSAPLLSVQTRTTTYTNMMIAQIPHEETADMFNTVALTISLKQVQIVSPSTTSQALPAASVVNPVNQSTVPIGEQQLGATTIVPAPVTISNPTQLEKGDALPQVPEPPNRSIKVPPRTTSPLSKTQWDTIYNAANFNGVP